MGIEKVLPKMPAEPGASHGPVRPHGVASPLSNGSRLPPEIGVMVGRPSARSVVDASRLLSIFGKLTNERKERFGAFRKVAAFRRPVVHFGIDVQRVVGTPRRAQFVVPDALQVRLLRSGA